MDAVIELEIGDEKGFYNLRLGETVRLGEWFVTKVPFGWIWTLKDTTPAFGNVVSTHHSVYVPDKEGA
jgi:hypothetical protein